MVAPLPRVRLVVCACVALLCLCACGQDPAVEGARVQILTSEMDGPVQGNLQLHAIQAGAGKTYALQRVRGDQPDLFVAPGAPPGAYGVSSSEGWGMLWNGRGSAAPFLRGADYPATPVHMGRPRTLYAGPADARLWQLSMEWSADARPLQAPADTPYDAIPLEIRRDQMGIVALGFPDRFWQKGLVVRVLGRLEGGPVTRLHSFEPGAGVVPELPSTVLVSAAPHLPFRVYLVRPAATATVPDGTVVRVETRDVPHLAAYEVRTKGGRASFDGVPDQGFGLRVLVPGDGPRADYSLDSATLRARGEMTLVSVPAGDAIAVDLPAEAAEAVEVRVLCEESRRFGRVSLLRSSTGRAVRVFTVRGRQDWQVLLRDGTWLTGTGLQLSSQGQAALVLQGPLQGCRVGGVVKGGGEGYAVELVRLMEAAAQQPERRVGGEGLVAAVSIHGRYDARVPPGRYAIRALRPSGAGGEPHVQDLRPGTQLRLDLSVR